LAQILIAEGRYSDADSIYVQAEALQDTLIGKADSLLVKTALITGAGKLYAHHFALIADHFKRPDEAYNVVEQGRGRAIVDLLLSGGAASPQAIETERAISKLRLQIKSLHSPDEIRRKREDIFLAEQARAVNPDLTILSTNQFQPIPLQTVQKSLRPSEMLLEYVLSEPCSYALVLTPTSKQIFTLASRKAIETMVTAYTTAVKNRTDSVRQARDLYTTLLGSIPGIESNSDYIVVPDGGLNLLPFDALINPHHRYVVESHVVTYSPSSTSFYLLRTKKLINNRPKAMLAVGGIPYSHSGIKRALVEREDNHDEEFEDLPNSEPEARLAAMAMPNPENTELKGSAATETNLKQLLKQQFGYIHLAVHAFSSDNPDRASLVVLSDPSNGEDGFIQASEIVQMRVPARLVVLSACETDVGPIQGEEGISALSTAFLLAGARTVVSTLWPIEDEPALVLMKRFYEHLGRNETAAEAMADAKRDLLSKYGERSLPIYWAGFVVQGSEPTLQGAH
jgi:CHAT domain-containing protein